MKQFYQDDNVYVLVIFMYVIFIIIQFFNRLLKEGKECSQNCNISNVKLGGDNVVLDESSSNRVCYLSIKGGEENVV